MALDRFEKDMNIIAALDDEPNDVGGLSAAELKGKFDEGGIALKTYINEVLLPRLEELGIEDVKLEFGNRYTKEQTDNLLKDKADTTTTNQLVKSISFDAKTGVFTITTQGGSVSTIDTLLERVPASFSLEGNQLVLTLEDGTRQTADLSAFVGNVLPEVTEEDNDKVLTAEGGEWKAKELDLQWEKIENKPFRDIRIVGVSFWPQPSEPIFSAFGKSFYELSIPLNYKNLLKTTFTVELDGVDTEITPTTDAFVFNTKDASIFTAGVLTIITAYTAGVIVTDSETLNVPEVGMYYGLSAENVARLTNPIFWQCEGTEQLDEKYLPPVLPLVSKADDGKVLTVKDGAWETGDVKFAEDLTTTYEIGNVILENGRAVIPAAGKTIQEVWNSIFVSELPPTVEEPKVTLTASDCKPYEVGTKVSPEYGVSLSAGSYSFGPDTGITASAWSVTDTNGNELASIFGVFEEFTVEDDTNYKITAVATHGAGAVPFTNLGNEYAAGQITAGEKSATSAAITGYRNGFYGTAADKEAEIDSSFVRGLANKSGKTPAAGNVWNLAIPVGAMRIAFAYPATIRDVSSVLDVNGLNAEIKSAFTKYTVSVEGANGYAGIDYKVYVLDRATAVTEANTFKITI